MQSMVMHFLSHLRYVGDFHRKCLNEILHMFTTQNRPLLKISVLITYVQSVMCLTADSGVPSSIPSRSHTFVEIDHENNFYGHSPPFP